MASDPPPAFPHPPRWQMTGADGTDMVPEVATFAAAIGLENAAPSRHSALLQIQLYAGAKSGRLNPAKVVHEIAILEGRGGPSKLKPATRFDRHAALRGLWHKHYLEDGIASMAINLRRGLKRHGLPLLQQMVDEAAAASEERFITEQDISAIADDAVRGTWERLQDQRSLTGEWIIYAVHAGSNYYLSLGNHKEGDVALRRQIESFCRHEFPFIADQLEPFEE